MNNAKQKIRWIRVLRPVALALALVFLLSCATYAWLKRDWKPKIHQENVKIVAGSSLTFIYGEDEIDDISVNELLGEKNFVFKSISNSTGKSEDFFALDYSSQGPYYDTFKKISLLELDEDLQNSTTKYTELGIKYGYVELTFHIASAGGDVYSKNIYLADSFINGVVVDGNEALTNRNAKAAEAVRISITAHKTDTLPESTTIFAKNATSHTGITNKHVDGYGYVADGAARYDRTKNPPELAKTVVFEVNAAMQEEDLKVTTPDINTFADFETTPLFILEKNTTRAVTVRIWLEGEDPNCEDDIADSGLDLLLQFSAKDIK